MNRAMGYKLSRIYQAEAEASRRMRKCQQQEVVCDYNGQLLSHKDANTLEDAMGYMFSFKFRATS